LRDNSLSNELSSLWERRNLFFLVKKIPCGRFALKN